jgi:hypothetical protein
VVALLLAHLGPRLCYLIVAISPPEQEISKQHGVGAIWKGFGVTAVREFPGYGAYFVGYEAFLQSFIPVGKTVNDVSAWKLMLCGALGGVCMWGMFFFEAHDRVN